MNSDEIVRAIFTLSGPELNSVRKALEQRREQLLKQSTVAQRRNYGRGILQLEYRANPKTGTQRGPYWYFYWREAGKQRSVYVGKTDDPEEVLSKKLS
ncbi:MAG: hypothetical protein QOI57_3377 [Rubrobacteraceae bacterium]|nr:hypothetical protein [Rubrobacteraceae bacterium]